MKQILFIHGGDSYNSYEDFLHNLKESPIDYERIQPSSGWKEWIIKKLDGYEILTPRFPSSDNAKYDEWVIYFEKLMPFLQNGLIVIGHSLGAMFLARYLNENTNKIEIGKLILIAGGYNEDTEGYGSFRVESASRLSKSALEIHLFHSKDDPVVPFTELAKFKKDLPSATSHVFEDRGHFNDETFPELLELLKQN